MKCRFIWVGKTRNRNWKALQDVYLERLSHFVKCEIRETKDGEGAARKETEGNRILEILNPKTFAVLLDVRGSQISSQKLADRLQHWEQNAMKDVTFIIGGAEGVSAAVAERADDRLSLSFLTFTHEAARVLLLEQLYRAFTIIRGFPYHNE